MEANYWAKDNLLEEETEQAFIKFGGEDSDTDCSNNSNSSMFG
jgi:hypothetical protein